MSKIIIAAILGACVGVAAIYVLNQPEPTPGERLGEAMDTAGEALKDAGEAMSDKAREAGEQISSDVQTAAADVAENVTAQALAVHQEAERLMAAWEDTGILTENGFDHDKAVKAIEDSALDSENKDKIIGILHQIREAPETFQQKINEIREILES